jgi:Sporulation inhibitor of replication protein SirA
MMRTYAIYLLKEEIAVDYIGKESLLFQLFNQFHSSSMYQKDIVEKQVAFITQLIPSMQLHDHLKSSLQSYSYYKVDEHEHHLCMPYEQTQAKLLFHDRYIEVRAKGSRAAETVFFEQLRKKVVTFFAIDSAQQFYGWLSPIKQKISM